MAARQRFQDAGTLAMSTERKHNRVVGPLHRISDWRLANGEWLYSLLATPYSPFEQAVNNVRPVLVDNLPTH